MRCWKSPPQRGSGSRLLHCCCPAFRERSHRQCCCCRAEGPTGSPSCALAALFGLTWDGDGDATAAAAAAAYDCCAARRVGRRPEKNGGSTPSCLSHVSYGCRRRCCLCRRHSSQQLCHFLYGNGGDAEQLSRSHLPSQRTRRRKNKRRVTVGALEETNPTS